MEIELIDKRIRQLCDEAAQAEQPHVSALFEELNTLLKQRSAFARYMAMRTFNHKATLSIHPATQKAADQ